MTMADTVVPATRRANVAIIVFAKDEEANIGGMIDAIADQTIFTRLDVAMSVYVVANGCSDRTAEFARAAASRSLESIGAKTTVFDWTRPGKSRSWNRVIHDEIPAEVDFIFALDADIEFVDNNVLESLFAHLQANQEMQVVSGYPAKDIERKIRPNLIDRLSMSISRQTRHSGVINGSLYLAKASCLREIWLPDDTPGEDGFLNAMVKTCGFSHPPRSERVGQLATPTHYFEGHSPANFFAHERRIIVGTMINRWIFEYLNDLQLTEPAGPQIADWNSEQPDWVNRLIEKKIGRKWLISRDILLDRLRAKSGVSVSYVLSLPVRCIAAILTVPPAITANRTLKARGAASTW